MTKMKRSEFKTLVKECVRECIREIMREQINPASIKEMFQPQTANQAQHTGIGIPGVGMINPMDERQMRLRNEIVAQHGMMQTQMQRQALQNPLQQQMGGMSELAGLESGRSERQSPSRFNTEGSGYTNPSDRLRFADHSMQRGYDSRLDGGRSAPQQEKRILRLDPSLDTPLGGGDIRAPDPNVLRNIYDDTMRTTLMEQHAAETQGPVADRFAAQALQSNPEDLFVGSQNWATLAFK